MENPIVVIGGGVIGLLTARELVVAGETVVVLDKGKLAKESSWAGGGILSPLYPWRYPESVNCIAEYGHTAYQAMAEELMSFGDIECRKTGMLILDTEESELAQSWAERKDERTLEHIDANSVQDIQAGIRGVEESAIWMKNIAHVRNPRVLKALIPYLLDKGVVFREGVSASGFRRSANGRLLAIQTSSGDIPAKSAIVCTGAWSGDLLKSTGLNLPVKPVKGQMLVFEPAPGLLKPMLMKNGRYLIPRKDGRILIGSTLEHEDYDKTTTQQARDDLYRSAVDMIPELAKLKIEHHWAGLRPGTPDGVPYISEHPGISGLYVNAGHYRNGLVMAPGSARLAADLILGRETVFSPKPYRLN